MRTKHVVVTAWRDYRVGMNEPTNISRGPKGWTVRIVRDGQQHSKYFRFSDGGVKNTLNRAKRWRDRKLRELGQRQWHSGPRKKASNNSSGTTGVSKNVYGRWVATWQEKETQRFKTFKTKKDAVAHRKARVGNPSKY